MGYLFKYQSYSTTTVMKEKLLVKNINVKNLTAIVELGSFVEGK